MDHLIVSYVNNNVLAKRITVVIDDDIDGKLRQIQAKLIRKRQMSVSYSRVLNDTVRKGLKMTP